MRRMLRNYKAYACTFKVLLILLMINGSELGSDDSSSSSTSSSSTSTENAASDDASDASSNISDVKVPTCGYANLARHTLTAEASRLKYGLKIDSKIADPRSPYSDITDSSFDSSTVCLPEDPDAKPFDEPQMHCYTLSSQAKLSHKNVTYRIKDYSRKLSKQLVDEAIARSVKAWADVSPLTFRKVDSKADSDISISFPPDLSGGILGVSFSPASGGLVELNDSVQWSLDSYKGYNLRQTATHEIGHVLGLDHSSDRAAVMYPRYPSGCSPNFTLGKDDIAGIQHLYGKPAHSPAPPPTSRPTPTMQRPSPTMPRPTPTMPRSTPTPPTGTSNAPKAPGNNFQPRPRSWQQTPQGHLYWPPARKGGRDMTWMWNHNGVRSYYRGGRGWFPNR